VEVPIKPIEKLSVQELSERPSLPNTFGNMIMPKSDLEREIEEILAKSR
jgi:hypothetical protein